MNKVAIFVDVQNIYYTTRDTFKRPFDYRKFYKKISENNTIVVAFAYAIDKGDAKQQGFQKALSHIGFEVKLKPYIQRADGSAKGDWDVGITIDVLEYSPQVDEIILLSGDGDFSLLLQKAKQKYQVKTSVYSVLNLSANALISSADNFVDIDHSCLL